jgi:hypothetical protein
MTGKPEAIDWSAGSVPGNALMISDDPTMSAMQIFRRRTVQTFHSWTLDAAAFLFLPERRLGYEKQNEEDWMQFCEQAAIEQDRTTAAIGGRGKPNARRETKPLAESSRRILELALFFNKCAILNTFLLWLLSDRRLIAEDLLHS